VEKIVQELKSAGRSAADFNNPRRFDCMN